MSDEMKTTADTTNEETTADTANEEMAADTAYEEATAGTVVEKAVDIPENPGHPEGDTGAAMLMRMNEHHKPLRKWGFSFIDWRPGMEILDVGCGGGAAVHEMLALSEGSIVKGIDHSEKSVALSKLMNAEAIKYERCRIEKAEVERMPFLDEEFDVVTAIETLYFWETPKAALREIRRVLRPGGKFVVLAEASSHETWAEDREKYPGAFIVYTPEEITELMQSAGFRDIKAERGEGENICVIGTK